MMPPPATLGFSRDISEHAYPQNSRPYSSPYATSLTITNLHVTDPVYDQTD